MQCACPDLCGTLFALLTYRHPVALLMHVFNTETTFASHSFDSFNDDIMSLLDETSNSNGHISYKRKKRLCDPGPAACIKQWFLKVPCMCVYVCVGVTVSVLGSCWLCYSLESALPACFKPAGANRHSWGP
eukprot:1161653-Pelagomonas_calceolata.AAC.12